MTETIEAETVHGSVQYEVTECDSCNREVSLNDAKTFVIGDLNDSASSRYHGSEYEFERGSVTEGHVCPACTDDPAGFPGSKYLKKLSPSALISSLMVAIVVTPPMAVANEFCDQINADSHDESFVKTMTAVVWVFGLLFAIPLIASALV